MDEKLLQRESTKFGVIIENFSPTIIDRYDIRDWVHIGGTIDYIIFDGLYSRGKLDKIVFVEIKTDDSQFHPNQVQVLHSILDKKIDAEVFVVKTKEKKIYEVPLDKWHKSQTFSLEEYRKKNITFEE